jgi:hypothetical protein
MLYKFMQQFHYGHPILKIPNPMGVISVWGDQLETMATIEKLYAMTMLRMGYSMGTLRALQWA